MEELRRAWAAVLLHWWPPEGLTSWEPQPALPVIAARALVDGLDTPALRELAGASGGDTREAREMLARAMVELGFKEPEPGASPWRRVRQLLDPAAAGAIERQLAVVQRDVDATLPTLGLLEPMLLPDGSVVVALPDGTYAGSGGEGWSCWTPDDEPATLAEVACAVQDCLVDVRWLQWPTCRGHDRMLHVVGDDDQPVWACDRGGEHPVAPVGALRG